MQSPALRQALRPSLAAARNKSGPLLKPQAEDNTSAPAPPPGD